MSKTAVARRLELHSLEGHQRARDVAGGHVRSESIDRELGLGRRHRHEHHARVSAQPAVGTGSAGVPGARRYIPDIAARHNIRPVFVLFDSCWDPDPNSGRSIRPFPAYTIPAGCRRRAAVLEDPAQYPRLEKYVKGVVGGVCRRSPDPRLGRLERARQRQRHLVRKRRAERQRTRSLIFCLRSLPGPARPIHPAVHQRPLAWGLGPLNAFAHGAHADQPV